MTSVAWLPAPDDDPNTAVARIGGDGFIDYVYISDDDTPRPIDGIIFSGKAAHVRVSTDAQGVPYGDRRGELRDNCGRRVTVYTYADAGVRCGEDGPVHEAKTAPVEGQVTATTSRNDGTATGGSATANVITVDTLLPKGKALAGRWMTVKAADGSGWAFQIERVKGHGVHVEGWLPFERTEDGLRRTFAPFTGTTVNGPVSFSVEIGATRYRR